MAGAASSGGGEAKTLRPAVLLGSHEPLLEWALRESGVRPGDPAGRQPGRARSFARGEGVASGLHVRSGKRRVEHPVIGSRFAGAALALVEFAWRRERGLIVAPGSESAYCRSGCAQDRRVAAPGRRRLLGPAAAADREGRVTDQLT